MTPNKLPPLPEPAIEITEAGQTSRYFGPVQMYEYAEDTIALRQSQSLPAGAVAWLEAEPGTTLAELCSARDFLTMYRSTLVHVGAREPAKRQPDNVLFPLYPALQADAREKGEAVFRLYPEELARMTHGPSLRAEEEDRLRSIYGDVAIPLYLHSGDYTEAMLLLEKQRELVENLRGQLDDAKADATDGCTEANCERCNTAIHSRGDMRHAGIGTYPATQPAQASEAVPSDDYQRGFRDGYERRHLEVLGALV